MIGYLPQKIANCPGLHTREEDIPLEQAELIFSFSKEYGVPVEAVEFVNEPNCIDITGFPAGYTVEDYGRDLVLDENNNVPVLTGEAVTAASLDIAPGSCCLIVL